MSRPNTAPELGTRQQTQENFSRSVSILRSMGFKDDVLSREALKAKNGILEDAIEYILANPKPLSAKGSTKDSEGISSRDVSETTKSSSSTKSRAASRSASNAPEKLKSSLKKRQKRVRFEDGVAAGEADDEADRQRQHSISLLNPFEKMIKESQSSQQLQQDPFSQSFVNVPRVNPMKILSGSELLKDPESALADNDVPAKLEPQLTGSVKPQERMGLLAQIPSDPASLNALLGSGGFQNLSIGGNSSTGNLKYGKFADSDIPQMTSNLLQAPQNTGNTQGSSFFNNQNLQRQIATNQGSFGLHSPNYDSCKSYNGQTQFNVGNQQQQPPFLIHSDSNYNRSFWNQQQSFPSSTSTANGALLNADWRNFPVEGILGSQNPSLTGSSAVQPQSNIAQGTYSKSHDTSHPLFHDMFQHQQQQEQLQQPQQQHQYPPVSGQYLNQQIQQRPEYSTEMNFGQQKQQFEMQNFLGQQRMPEQQQQYQQYQQNISQMPNQMRFQQQRQQPQQPQYPSSAQEQDQLGSEFLRRLFTGAK